MELTPRLFVALWGATLLAAVGWALRRRLVVAPSGDGLPMERRPVRKRDVVAAVMLGVLLVGYALIIVWREDFAYYDENIFTDLSLAGRRILPPIWPVAGRFFPLAHQEFNLIGLISHSATGFHLYAVVQLFALAAALLYLLRDVSLGQRVLTIALLLSAQSVVIAFTGLMFPERNIVVLLAVFMAAIREHDRRGGRVSLAVALATGQFLLYYKEPMVVLIGVIVSARLLIRFVAERPRNAEVPRWLLRSPLEVGLVALSFVFVALFALVMLPNRSTAYVSGAAVSRASALAYYLASDPFFGALLVACAMRVATLRRQAWRAHGLWDAMMVGGLAYAFAVIGVGLRSPYYMAPTDAIAAVTLPWAVAKWWAERPAWFGRVTVCAAAAALALVTIGQSAFRVVERKNMVRGTAAVARFLADYTAASPTKPVRVYFPLADGFAMMRLSSYLRSRGIAVPTTLDSAAVVELGGPSEFSNGLCVPYAGYACRRLTDGDLVVLASDDRPRGDDVTRLLQTRPVLFRYRPAAFPPLFRHLAAALFPVFAPIDGRGISEQWLEWTVARGP